MLRRKITDRLHTWKQTSNKALLVTGARQVGKSYAISAFGKESFGTYFEANLLLDADARATLVGARSARDFINRIALLSQEPLEEGDTLIFIDEIQEYPEIVTLAKALVEDGRYRYVFSGSMLGTEFKGISSFPVGYVEQITMRPMDFEEFSWAIGTSEGALAKVRAAFHEQREVERYLHEGMMRNFRTYVLVGGMPEVVQTYINGGYSLVGVQTLQKSLVSQYAQDIAKYADRRALEVRDVFNHIPLQLAEDPHRFVMSTVQKNARYSTYDHDFLWLVNAGVALMVHQVTEAKAPLKRTEVPERFKLYQSDTGMLVSRYPQSTSRAIYLNYRQTNLGGIYENVVAQELAAAGVPLWYYKSTGIGEVDFLMEGKSGHVVPVEVKSGKKVRSHAALNKLMSSQEYKIREAIVLSSQNLMKEGNVLYVPFYMASCLNELTEKIDDDFTIAPVIL